MCYDDWHCLDCGMPMTPGGSLCSPCYRLRVVERSIPAVVAVAVIAAILWAVMEVSK